MLGFFALGLLVLILWKQTHNLNRGGNGKVFVAEMAPQHLSLLFLSVIADLKCIKDSDRSLYEL